MKKVYRLKNLDCANCAAKMERSIAKIEGVKSVSISFMTQRMTIEIAEENFENARKKIIAAVKKIEPECEIVGI